jgi:hypothetical protein
LKQISKRANYQSKRQRAMILLASSSGMSAPQIAAAVRTDESHVRKVIHAFNEQSFDSLDPDYRGEEIAAALGGRTRVERIPTPGDCVDGFFEAFWRRPEGLLDPAVRSAQSMWTLLEPGVEERIVDRLAAALDSGAWDAEHGHLREQDSFQGALRLVVSEV